MIDLSFEEKRPISTQEMYDIIAFAVEAANEGGFINAFVLERAIIVYAALVIDEEHREEIQKKNSSSLLAAWDYLVEEGIAKDLLDKYELTLARLAGYASVWADDRMDYEHSVRGLLDTIQTVSGDIVENMRKNLSETVNVSDVKEVLQVAKDWGLNRDAKIEDDEKSLFRAE